MSTINHIELWRHKSPAVHNIGENRKLELLVSEGRSILATIGNTPLVRIRNIRPRNEAVEIYAKAEWLNPGGSVKDRPALNMLLEAERTGRLIAGKTIIDATSGNTGIAYALIGSALGYRVKLALPSNASEERKRILRAYGAELLLTDPLQGTDGAQRAVKEVVEENPGRYFYPDQYNNPANWEAHYKTTAKEIWHQTQGRVTHFVAGIGTSGTFVGNSRRLREFDRRIRCISFEPDSPLHGMEGLKHLPTAIVPGIFDPTLADKHTTISTNEAFAMARRLAKEEGLFVGSSSGAALAVCLALAEELNSGVLVTVFPDGGTKYVNEKFWNV